MSAESREPAPQAAVRLDLRAVICPLNLMKTRAALEGMHPGEVLEVVVTDPKAMGDIPKFARQEGHAVVAASRGPDGFRISIRRGGESDGGKDGHGPQRARGA